MTIFLLILKIVGLLIAGAFLGSLFSFLLFYLTSYKLYKGNKLDLRGTTFNIFLTIAILSGIFFFGLFMGAYR